MTAFADSPRVWEALRDLVDPGRLALYRGILGRIPHESLLDLGCGTGYLCRATRAAYTGVDISPARIAYARRRHGAPGRRFETGDALAPDAALGHHDLVAVLSVIHHMTDAEVARCLAATKEFTPARLLLVDVALERTGWIFRSVIRPLDRGGRFRTTAELRVLAGKAGWRVERAEECRTVVGLFPYAVIVAVPEAA